MSRTPGRRPRLAPHLVGAPAPRARRYLVVAAAVVVLCSVAVALAVIVRSPETLHVSTSSSAPGSRPSELIGGPLVGRRPALARWRSGSSADGSWVQLAWTTPHRVGTTSVSVATAASSAAAVIVTFDDGSAVHMTPDAKGVATSVFPRRSSRTVRFTVQAAVGVGPVAFAGVDIRPEGLADGDGSTTTVSASTARPGDTASGALDGDIASGVRGRSWIAAQHDERPWIRETWSTPRSVDALVVVGAGARGAGADAAVGGYVEFSDGSRVDVAGIDGSGPPTTVAFMPRTVTSATLHLDRAGAGIGEFRWPRTGEPPPRWPTAGEDGSHAPQAAACGPSDDGPSTAALALVCPVMGDSVGDTPVLTLADSPRRDLVVSARSPSDASGSSWNSITVGRGATDRSGLARLRLRLGQLPFGPVGLVVEDSLGTRLHLQLFHRGGVTVADRGHPPAGMTLQWDEGFGGQLSVSESGRGAEYGATKPEPEGSGQFGDAPFADPATSPRNIATDSGFLRLALTPSRSGSGGLDGALLSSSDDVGAGFSAQYGYFEARVLGAPGPGSWPAFWMLDASSAVHERSLVSEVDAVEMYGHDVTSSCHSIHAYTDGRDSDVPSACVPDDAFRDWALQWHTYAVRVVPGSAVFFVDGKEVARRDGLHLEEEPMFFLLDLALGGGWPVDLSATGDRTAFYVDWVRVYT